MNYKELLEKYKAGTATPEERAVVDDELEKYESINEYLAGGLTETLPVQAAIGNSDASSGKRVRRNILKRFVLTAAITLAVVAIAVVSVFYVISPQMDDNAYQPLKSRTTEQYGFTKLSIDLAAFTELHFPGIITNSTTSVPLGFGKYDVELTQWDVFTSTFERYVCRIDGKRFKNLTNSFFSQFPVVNSFRHGIYMTDDLWEYGDAPALEEIRKLPETTVVKAYISFKEDLPLDDVLKIRNQVPHLVYGWIAVRCCEKDRQQLPQIGFVPEGAGVVIPEDAFDQEKYPNFELAWLYEPLDSTGLATHFISLLKYMSDNTDFLELLNWNPKDIYSQSLDYVEKNGIQSYGVMVIGSGKDLLALRELPEIDGLWIDNVKISSYSK